MTTLDKLAALCKAMSPGPWGFNQETWRDGGLDLCDRRLIGTHLYHNAPSYEEGGRLADNDAFGITVLRNVADELVAVALATEKLLAKSWQKVITDKVMTGVENDFQDRWFDAKDALAALRDALEKT